MQLVQLSHCSDLELFLVDEFHVLNGEERLAVEWNRERFKDTVLRLGETIGCVPRISTASELMRGPAYAETFSRLDAALAQEHRAALARTVPPGKDPAYPLHEIACTLQYADRGFAQKVGPGKETQYDTVMQELGVPIGFAYLSPAYALATRTLDEVVHYVPRSCGPNNGQRILFDDAPHAVRSKITGHDDAVRNIARLAAIHADLAGNGPPSLEEIDALHGKRLRKVTYALVMDVLEAVR